MRLLRSSHLVSAVIVLVGLPAAVSHADEYTFTLIADTSGEIATFRFGLTNLDNFGNVAFRADLDNGVEGVFKGNGGPLTTIALNQGRFAGYHFENFAQMNSVGTVAFGGNGDESEEGIFTSDGGSITTIAET